MAKLYHRDVRIHSSLAPAQTKLSLRLHFPHCLHTINTRMLANVTQLLWYRSAYTDSCSIHLPPPFSSHTSVEIIPD